MSRSTSRPRLAAWAESYLVPKDAPMDPDLEQKWLDQVARAERDLELRGEGPGSEPST